MKTRELIKTLQEMDPSGDMDVVIDHRDIYTVIEEPAYYDGPTHLLQRNEAGEVIGYKIHNRGSIIDLSSMDLETLLLDFPDFPIDLSELDGKDKLEWSCKIREMIDQSIRINAEIDADLGIGGD